MTELTVTCDKCKTIIAMAITSLIELRTGESRRRVPLDLCRACAAEFRRWLGTDEVNDFVPKSSTTAGQGDGEAPWEEGQV